MSKQPKKFCRITKYIEKTDPKLFEILEDLCALGTIKPRRGHAGITFIYPSKETISKLDKLRYSDQIETGVDIILAHIVHDFLKSPADWNAKKSDIPNGHNNKIEVKEVKGSKIVLADGAELEVDAKFVPFNDRNNNQAVYRVTKGELDHTKHTKRATFEHARVGDDGRPMHHQKAAHGGGRAMQAKVVRQLHESLCFALCQHEIKDQEKAIAPFNFLVNFADFVEQGSYDKDVKFFSKLVHACFTPLTNTYFAFGNPLLAGALADFLQACQSDEQWTKKVRHELFGRDKYEDLCQKNFHSLCQEHKAGGGMSRREAFDKLQEALAKAAQMHVEKLKSLGFESADLAKHFAALCWARCSECDTVKRLRADPRDCHDDLRDLCDVVQDQACGNAIQVPEAELRTMIVGLLEAAQEFKNSQFCCFPFAGEASKQCFEQCREMADLYEDKSISKAIGDIPAEELAVLLADA